MSLSFHLSLSSLSLRICISLSSLMSLSSQPDLSLLRSLFLLPVSPQTPLALSLSLLNDNDNV